MRKKLIKIIEQWDETSTLCFIWIGLTCASIVGSLTGLLPDARLIAGYYESFAY